MSDLSTQSTENLTAEQTKLQSERAEIANKQRNIADELNSRVALEKVKKHVEGLTDTDKAKLAQSLQVSGIASAEAIGKVG